MSQVGAFIVTLLVLVVIMTVLIRIMPKRVGIIAAQPTLGRRILMFLLVTAAVIVGMWIGYRGELSDPFTIVLALTLWAFAMFVAFRRPKRI